MTAKPIPVRRARSCCERGNLLARMEIKVMLSTPNVISKAAKVIEASQVSGLVNHSMVRAFYQESHLLKRKRLSGYAFVKSF